MIERARRYLDQGIKVKIFTARANDPRQHHIIRDWLRQVGLPKVSKSPPRNNTR